MAGLPDGRQTCRRARDKLWKGVKTLANKKYSKEQLTDFYRTMVRIRTFEEKAAECFTKGMLAGNIHLSIEIGRASCRERVLRLV